MVGAKRLNFAAGVVVLFLAGCANQDFFALKYLQTSGPGQDRVIAGSVESVSQSTQGALRELGISALLTKEGEDMRLTYNTKAGDHFALVFSRVKTDKGEQTRVHVEGSKNAGEQPHVQVLAKVEADTRR